MYGYPTSYKYGTGDGYPGVSVPPFAPTDIAGLTLWLKADSIVGLNDGDAVSTWSDSSGNGNDGTQAVGANRPTYQTNEVNNLPAVQFVKVPGQWLDFPSITAIAAWTVFLVMKSSESALDWILTGGGDNHSIVQGATASKISYYNSPGEVVIGNISTAAYQVITCNAGSSLTGAWRIGQSLASGFLWSGLMAEVIAYDSALSGADITSVQGYLTSKYGL